MLVSISLHGHAVCAYMCAWVHACNTRMSVYLIMNVCALCFTSGYKSLIIHHALICYKPVNSMDRRKCHRIHISLSRSLFLSFSHCFFVSCPVLFSFSLFIFASCLHCYQSVSSVFVFRFVPLTYSLLFSLSHFALYLFESLSMTVLHSQPERKRHDNDAETDGAVE